MMAHSATYSIVNYKKCFCPICGVLMEKIYCEEIVDANSPRAKEINPSFYNEYGSKKVMFHWIEVRCDGCDIQMHPYHCRKLLRLKR